MQLSLPFTRSQQLGFDEFVEAPGTDAVRFLADPGEAHALVVGAPGTGKTHLLTAACQQAYQQQQQAAYIPLADTDTLTPAILQGLASFDLVCVDDLHRVAGQPEWETALFNCYNECDAGAARLVVAGTGAAQEVGFQLPDLVSRLRAALVLRTSPLDDEEAVVALRRRAAFASFELPDAVARFLLRRIPRDMPTLVRALDALAEHTFAEQRKVTVPSARAWLEQQQID